MSKLKILVLGAGGNVSIAILKAIHNSNIDAYVLGACVQKYAAGFSFCNESILSPFADDESFIPWIEKIINNYKIEVILSGVEEINNILAHINISDNNCKILVPEREYLEIFSDKLSTIKWLMKNNINYPLTLDLSDTKISYKNIEQQLEIPFILKPRIGKGSENLFIVKSEEEYFSIENKEQYVAQKLIGDKESEYTCGIYKSKFGYLEIIIMRRLLRNGSTVMAEVEDNKIIYDYCKKIADACNTTVPFNIQLRLCAKTQKPYCFEINMRLSGTTAIRHKFGFKDCQVWIKEVVQNKNFHSDFNVIPAIAIRYEAEVFLNIQDINDININQPTTMEIK